MATMWLGKVAIAQSMTAYRDVIKELLIVQRKCFAALASLKGKKDKKCNRVACLQVVTVYNKTRDFDYGWSKVSIPLGRRTQFGLIVEAVWGIDEKGTLLLDDFSFQKCSPG